MCLSFVPDDDKSKQSEHEDADENQQGEAPQNYASDCSCAQLALPDTLPGGCFVSSETLACFVVAELDAVA